MIPTTGPVNSVQLPAIYNKAISSVRSDAFGTNARVCNTLAITWQIADSFLTKELAEQELAIRDIAEGAEAWTENEEEEDEEEEEGEYEEVYVDEEQGEFEPELELEPGGTT
jgi:hypothetical protein